MRQTLNIALIALLMLTMTSCEAIGDLMEASFWVGVIVVVLVIAIILWVIRKIT